MARKIELEMSVGGLDKVNSGLRDLETSLSKMKEQLLSVDKASGEYRTLTQSIKETEQEINNLNGAVQETGEVTGSLRAQLRAIREELQQLEPGTARFEELSIRAGELTDQIADTQAVIQATAGSPLENLGTGLGTATRIGMVGFQGVQSAMALFGSESQDLMKTMVKLQAVMGLTQTIKDLGGMKDTMVTLKASFTAFSRAAMAGLSGIQKAIIATGIGALVVAVGLLIAYWDDIKGAVSGVSEEQKKLVKLAEQNVQLAEKELAAFDNQTNSLRLQGKSEREILELRLEKINAIIKEQEIYISTMEEKQKMEVAAAKRNQEITQGIIRGIIEFNALALRILVAPMDLLIETANKVAEVLGFDKITTTNLNKEISKLTESLSGMAATFLFDPEEVATEGQKVIDEQKQKLDKLKSDRDGLLLQMKAMDKAEADNSIRTAEEKAKRLEELRKEELVILKEIEARKKTANEAAALIEISKLEEGEREKILLQRAFDDERLGLIEKSNVEEVKKLDEKYAKGLIDTENYFLEVEKLRADDSRLTDEERKLLLLKETEMRNKILELEKEGIRKKTEERKKFEDYLQSQETDARTREINSVQKAFDDDINKLKEFLKNKSITQEEYDNEERKRAKKLTEDLEEIDKKFRDESLGRIQEGIGTIASVFNMLRDSAAGLFGSIGTSLSVGLSRIIDVGKMKFEEFEGALERGAQKVNAYAQVIGGMIQGVLGAVSEEQRRRLDENLSRVAEIYNQELALLEGQKSQGLLTEEAAAKAKFELDTKRFNEEEKMRKAAFENEKGMKIANAITSGLMGAVAAFAGAMSLGPIAGPLVGGILAGMVAALTSFNVSQIEATQYRGGTPPSFNMPPSGFGGGGLTEAPTPPTTTLFGDRMTEGNTGGSEEKPGEKQMTVRAYVLETDITGTQNTISTYEQRAEIG